jgi:hypothetical protein
MAKTTLFVNIFIKRTTRTMPGIARSSSRSGHTCSNTSNANIAGSMELFQERGPLRKTKAPGTDPF